MEHPKDVRTVQWSMNVFPHLAYVPTTVRFDGPLFLRLAYDRCTLPLKRDHGCWKLAKSVAESWQQLEQCLLYVMDALIQKSRVLLPLEYTNYPLPQNKGYLSSHWEERFAIKCALSSRNSFVPLMAKCSFAIALISGEESPFASTPSWIEYLRGTHNLHPEWLEQLRQSLVCDLSSDNPRVGLIVDVRTMQITNLIPVMLHTHIPLWFHWGSYKYPPARFNRKDLDSWCPTLDELNVALTSASAPPSEPSHMSPNAEVLPRHPKPKPDSQQRAGETWQQFFERESVIHAGKELSETVAEQKKRLDRTRSQGTTMPGKKGPKVYAWFCEDSFRIWTKINRGEIEKLVGRVQRYSTKV